MKNRLLHKIKGLTIMELLVSIIIATFIVGICFTVLNLVSKNVFTIQNNYEEGTTFNLFKEQIAADLYKYPSAHYRQFDKRLVFSSPIDSVVYKLQEDLLLRNGDTLKIALKQSDFYFLGNPIEHGAIDAIKCIGKDNPNENTFFLNKKNDMNTIILNGN